jgi:TRAP-type C4-dicarboxylate transport system, small permease component
MNFEHPRGVVMSSKIASFEKFAYTFSNRLNRIAGAGMVAMLVLIVADIIATKAFKWPIPGGIEMVGFLGVIVIAFSIAQTQVLHGHIEVEFLVTHLPKTAQKVTASIVYSFGMVLFAVLAWKSYDFGHILQASGEISMTQGIPFYPFVYGIAFCCISVFLVLLVQLLRTLTKT